MAEKNAFLMYKNRPLVRCGNKIYYGNMADGYVCELTIQEAQDERGLKMSKKIIARRRRWWSARAIRIILPTRWRSRPSGWSANWRSEAQGFGRNRVESRPSGRLSLFLTPPYIDASAPITLFFRSRPCALRRRQRANKKLMHCAIAILSEV